MNRNSSIYTSLLWKLLERIGTQGIQFIIQLILARILIPEDYGILAIIMIFITLANVFVQSGFNTALIQRKDIDENDYSSVFYLSLFVAFVVYIILYIFSPLIAKFYNMNELIKLLRVLSLTLFLGAFNSIQNAIIAKNMDFKKQFFSSLIGILISGIIGIILAYNNFGVWTLVYQQLINQMLISFILWRLIGWRPKLYCSFARIKVLFSFSGKLLLSSLMDTLYMNITGLFIGKMYSPSILGYYNRGNQFPQLIVSNLNGSIQSVIFPVLAAEQENKKRIKEIMKRSIKISTYIIFPLMTGLIIVSEPLVKIVLTDKWILCIPYIRIFSLSYALWPLHTINLQAINAIGRSDIFLKMEFFKKIIGLIILIISINYGVYAIAIGVLISGVISIFINGHPNKKLFNYGYIEQIRDIIPAIGLSLIMGIIIYWISFFNLKNKILLLLQIIVGITIYLILSYILKLECLIYILELLKKIIKKRGK